MENMIEQHKETISLILTIAGFIIPLFTTKGSLRFLIAGFLATTLLVIMYVLFQFSIALFIASLVIVISVSGVLYFRFRGNRPPVVEKITLSQGTGFVIHPEFNYLFLQKERNPGAMLKIRIGLTNPADVVYYIKYINFVLTSYQSFNDLPIELVTKIVTTFEETPSKDKISQIETAFNVRFFNQLDEMVVFQVEPGNAGRMVERLKTLPGIKAANPSLSGEGQSPIDFVTAPQTAIISPNNKKTSIDIDAKLPNNDAAGLEITLQFRERGKYILQPEIHYAGEKLQISPITIFVSD